MTYGLEEFAEGLLVVVSLQALRHLEVDLAEVHAHRVGRELLEELVHELDAHAVPHGPGGRLELEGVERVHVEGDPVVLGVVLALEIVLEVVADVGEILAVANLCGEAQDLLWVLRVRESPSTEVAEVRVLVNTFPVLHVWHITSEDSQGHVKVVVILLGVDPEELRLWVEGLGASDRANRLGVVTAEHDWEVAIFESCMGLPSQALSNLDSVVLGNAVRDFLDLLIFRGEGTWTLSGVLSGKADAFGSGGSDFFVLDWDFVGGSEVLEPVLVLQPLWSAGGSFVVFAASEWVAEHFDLAY